MDHGPDEPPGRAARRARPQTQPQVRNRGTFSQAVLFRFDQDGQTGQFSVSVVQNVNLTSNLIDMTNRFQVLCKHLHIEISDLRPGNALKDYQRLGKLLKVNSLPYLCQKILDFQGLVVHFGHFYSL